MQMSHLYASDFPFKNLCKIAQHTETIRKKNVWEKSNDAYSLLIRVQTTINHISIFTFLFFTTISTWIVKRLDWKRRSRGLISHRRLVVSCFKMASFVSIIVEICDPEKMANMWRKTAKIYGLLPFTLFFSPVLEVVRF